VPVLVEEAALMVGADISVPVLVEEASLLFGIDITIVDEIFSFNLCDDIKSK